MFVSVRIVDYGIASLLMFYSVPLIFGLWYSIFLVMFVSVPLSYLSMRFPVSQFPFTTLFFFRLDHNVEHC